MQLGTIRLNDYVVEAIRQDFSPSRNLFMWSPDYETVDGFVYRTKTDGNDTIWVEIKHESVEGLLSSEVFVIKMGFMRPYISYNSNKKTGDDQYSNGYRVLHEKVTQMFCSPG